MTICDFNITPYGERGWLARFSKSDYIASGLYANAVADILRTETGVTDAVAGIDSVAVRYDPTKTDASIIHTAMERAFKKATSDFPDIGPTIELPVCYGGEFGPDMKDVCAHSGLSEEEVISAHSRTTYRVITCGFAPGFAYLGPLDKRLHIARLDTPRAHVPAGAVAVAGGFSGVYPLSSPGGWRIIGRTPVTLFDPSIDRPFRLETGASIRFAPVDFSEFQRRATR